MSRFVNIGDSIVNVDVIESVCTEGDGDDACITYKDGTRDYVPYRRIADEIQGRNLIRQIIPVKTPTFVIYKCERKLFESEIFYLALTESGDIRPVEWSGDYYDFADDVDNFVRLEERGTSGWQEYNEDQEGRTE